MLTEQRKRLVEEYIKLRCKDQRQAAINAGYSPRSAAVQACDILKNPEVQEYLQEQKRAVCRRVQEELAISASDAVVSAVGNSARPTMPIIIAAASAITTQTIATRRARLSSSSLRMAMKRSNTCGIPK